MKEHSPPVWLAVGRGVRSPRMLLGDKYNLLQVMMVVDRDFHKEQLD